MIGGGRLFNYYKYADKLSPFEYAHKVIAGEILPTDNSWRFNTKVKVDIASQVKQKTWRQCVMVVSVSYSYDDIGFGVYFRRNENNRGYQEEIARNKWTYQKGTKQSQIPIPYWSAWCS